MSDFVQNRFFNKPLFFIGCSSPSQASTIINPDYPADGVMISVNRLRSRISNFKVKSWILDSGAFTEISTYGEYRFSVEEYIHQIRRWSKCGQLLRAVSQDYMCEPFILQKTGLSVERHQQLTIERLDQIRSYPCSVAIMPVIQGYNVSDYISHVQMYGNRLAQGEWVGVGSVCRRNNNPLIIKDILKSIKLIRPDLQLHGFGLKQIALEDQDIRSLLYSSDSMAWSMPRKFKKDSTPIELAHNYQKKVLEAINNNVQKRIPVTAGAGNGQGRKPKWKSGPTKAIRIPEKFADQLLAIAHQMDKEDP